MKKTEFRFFDITDYEKEGEYLSKMHKKGWKISKMYAPGFYVFEYCEPCDMVYQLDYNQEGLKNKDEYVQMFEDCGWEYVGAHLGYTYFRKPAAELNEDEGIFCDDLSRFAMIERIFKGRMIPLIVIFFSIIIPQLGNISRYMENSSFASILFKFYIVMFVIYVCIFIKFAISYSKLKQRIK